MKKFLILSVLAVMAAAVMFVSCSDDDNPAIYYVRYTVGGTPGGKFDVSYTNVTGEYGVIQQINPAGKVEVVVGPVEAGFKAELAASVDAHASEYLQIDVSRDGKPFVQKRNVAHGTYIYYTITSEDR